MASPRTRDELIGANLALLREAKGYRQSDLAERLQELGLSQMHQNTISRIEKGERPLRLSEAEDIAKALGMPLWNLTAHREVARVSVLLQEIYDARRTLSRAALTYIEQLGRLRMEYDAMDAETQALFNAQDFPGVDVMLRWLETGNDPASVATEVIRDIQDALAKHAEQSQKAEAAHDAQ